jgi:hypothetical protein
MRNVKRIYRAVRNILFNELGLSREKIDNYINAEVSKRVEHFLSHTNLNMMIAKVIRTRMDNNDGVLLGDNWSNYGKTLDKKINEAIEHEFKDQIEEKVKKSLSKIKIDVGN